jgi:predicted acylesterase/phospholipase RssA
MPPEEERPRNGKIITFYSYKGGTGRSMTLANVAWVLASNGKKVLTIDWDLEAPGLHRYFYPFLVDKDLTFSDGLINFVHNYKTRVLSPPKVDENQKGDEKGTDGDKQSNKQAEKWLLKHADIRKYSVTLKRDFRDGGQIDFVPAGRQDDTYSDLVNQFNWEDFYERLGGNRFFDSAAELMRKKYDYVLIDSRTGVSDTSGICTVKMPDTLVLCFTLNYQGINGGAAVADYVYQQRVKNASESSRGSDGRPMFNIFPVAMRLEDAQKRKMERRREYARDKKFKNYPIYLHDGETRKTYWANVKIDYSSFYAYEEILAAFGEKEQDVTNLLAAVERLTAYLTDGKVKSSLALPQPDREEILKEFEGETYEPGATEEKPGHLAQDVFASLPPEQHEAGRKIILRLVRIAGPNETEHTGQIVGLDEFDSQLHPVIETLRSFQLLSVGPDATTSKQVVRIASTVSLRDWKQLNEWIDGDKEFLLWRQSLREQANQWTRSSQATKAEFNQKEGSELLRGGALAMAKIYFQTHRSDLSPTERQYIEASVALRERERQERERTQQEKAATHQTVEQLEGERRKRAESVSKGKNNPLKNFLDRFKPDTPPAKTDVRRESPNVIMAKDILRGTKASPREVLALAKKLKGEKFFNYARRLLARARLNSELNQDWRLKLTIYQESALCTYKDTDLPSDRRLDLALDILRQVEDLENTVNQETLGLTGAIYKRKWENDNQKHQLELSLSYYLRGYEQDPVQDLGYTGINAAFILDLLAYQESEEAGGDNISSDVAEQRRAQARRIREEIVRRVAPLIGKPGNEWLASMWWFYGTVAEALFGLQQYEDAVMLLQQGREAIEEIPEWEYESTVRQLARLAALQSDQTHSGRDFEETPAWIALRRFFGNHVAPVRTAFLGKFGFALSGGGFRASLFHIGVLAKLAELDLLRHVEVLSCVSGGAIIGAHYYLEVRKLLQMKSDEEVTQQDYVDIVRRIQQDFLEGVQRNIRTRVGAEFITNLKMIFGKSQSRTKRAGELYEREIFSRVTDGEGQEPRWLNDLYIMPLGEGVNFNPKNDNWRRAAKVPILILNATTLNTGHNWQFTASWLGEPPAGVDSEIDGNDYLRRMYYWEAPDEHKHIRLGHAVAASACVPAIFEPLVLENLYPNRTIRLVDGGVCDNQGVSGLLEQDCTVVLVSDGSGQMESQKDPSAGLLGVPLRSNSILQARVRQSQYKELLARRRSSLLRGFMFAHLKEDLDVDPIDWVDCLDPFDASDDAREAARKGPLTSYGVAKEVQLRLAAVRTDLDSFSDIEAYSLMTSAYRMTEQHFKNSNCIDGFVPSPKLVSWDFLSIEPSMKGSGKDYKNLKDRLSVSNSMAFKIWKLSRAMRVLSGVLGVALIAAAVWLGYKYSGYQVVPPISIGKIGLWVSTLAFVFAGTYILGKSIMRAVRWRETLARISFGIVMSLLGWILARAHLYIFDRWFLKDGSIKTLLSQRDVSNQVRKSTSQ